MLHTLDIEIIRNLQWPNNNIIFDRENVTRYKRPSPFWISTQLVEKSRKGMISGIDKLTRGQVIERWDIVSQAMRLRTVIDPNIVGMQKSSAIFKGSLPDIAPQSIIDSYPDNIDTLHEGLALKPDGMLESGISIDIFHKDEKELSKIISDLTAINPTFKLQSVSKYSSIFNSDKGDYKRLKSYDGSLRRGVVSVMTELIKDPVVKINEMSSIINLSRSSIKKIYGDIISSGAIIFEPTMTGKWIGEGISAIVFFSVPEKEKRSLDSFLVNESIIGERHLLKRIYVKDSLGYLCWVNDFYDAVQFQEAILEKSGRFRPTIILFSKSTTNMRASIKLLENNSNSISRTSKPSFEEQIIEDSEQD